MKAVPKPRLTKAQRITKLKRRASFLLKKMEQENEKRVVNDAAAMPVPPHLVLLSLELDEVLRKLQTLDPKFPFKERL